MSWLVAADPLALLAISSGQVNTPGAGGAAQAANGMEGDQKAAVIGEPVPVVFGRRLSNAGGVMVGPPAGDCRFANDMQNNLSVWYLLIISQGVVDDIQVRDVFQGGCRIGVISQAYSARAGTWTPGNYLADRGSQYKLQSASRQCGTIGAYPGITTLSFEATFSDGIDFWKKKVSVFIRGGMYVNRFEDNVFGPSNSFADLARWMMQQTAMMPDALIDNDALAQADVFCRANGLTCNGLITASANLSDFLATWSKYFLLSESNKQGKRGLRPLLPFTSYGFINTAAISPAYTFDESSIVDKSFELSYVSLGDRLPFLCEVIWRQQQENDYGIVRTAEVSYGDTTIPKETHDLSQFCTSEIHAVRVGAYILARRRYVSHTCKFTALPGAHGSLINPGDVVRVVLARQASTFAPTVHDFFYQVERISKDALGHVMYECSHFPIDASQRSLIALDVANVQATGLIIPSNLTGLGCDLNSATDTTVPQKTQTPVTDSNPKVTITPTGGDYGGNGGPTTQNPTDGLENPAAVTFTPNYDPLGNTIGYNVVGTPMCPGGQTPSFFVSYTNTSGQEISILGISQTELATVMLKDVPSYAGTFNHPLTVGFTCNNNLQNAKIFRNKVYQPRMIGPARVAYQLADAPLDWNNHPGWPGYFYIVVSFYYSGHWPPETQQEIGQIANNVAHSIGTTNGGNSDFRPTIAGVLMDPATSQTNEGGYNVFCPCIRF
jgi:hypothetical protein